MTRWDRFLTAYYRSGGVVVDTNILLLWVVGTLAPGELRKYPRVAADYTTDDCRILDEFLARFRSVVTTSHLLTEASNLLGRKRAERETLLTALARRVTVVDEVHVPGRDLVGEHSLVLFRALGITDAAVIHLAKGKRLILTDDLELIDRLTQLQLDVVNFNHLRWMDAQ